MIVVYISGPITGIPEGNRSAFAAAEVALSHAGHKPVNPREIQPPVDPAAMSWADWMRLCLAAMLAECTGLALLAGWEASRGARVERGLAVELGMDVRPLGAWVSQGTVAPREV